MQIAILNFLVTNFCVKYFFKHPSHNKVYSNFLATNIRDTNISDKIMNVRKLLHDLSMLIPMNWFSWWLASAWT